MIELIKYSPIYEKETLHRICDFFGFHRNLFNENICITEESLNNAKKTINDWISENHTFYIIIYNYISVGFIHIGFRGENVAWIEDVYVDKEYRGQGIASEAIKGAENIIKQNKSYNAVCMDVSPRNLDALKLYYRLGYVNLSIITVHKELYENKQEKKTNLLGFEFNI